MAVFPDRIVLKNSTDGDSTIRAAIASGGSDQINPGELVVGRITGGAALYTVDSEGSIVTIGSGASTIVSETEPGAAITRRYWRLVNFTSATASMGQFVINDIHLFSEDTQDISGSTLGTPATLTYSLTAGIAPTSNVTNAFGLLSGISDNLSDFWRPTGADVADPAFYLQWDLGTPQAVAFINIASEGDANRVDGFDIQYSDDGTNWTHLKSLLWDKTSFSQGWAWGDYKSTGNLDILNQGAALEDGDLWFKPSTSELYVYYNSAWVLISGETSTEESSVRGDGGNFDTGEVSVAFAMGVYGGGDFNAGSATTELVTPFAHAYIDSNNVSSVTAHSGISSAAHVYTASVESYIDFTFDTTQPNTNYSVLHSGESSFNDMEVENKTTTGFRISFYDDATGNPLSTGAVGIGAPVITVYESDPTVGVFTTDGVDLPVELLNTDDGPDGGSF